MKKARIIDGVAMDVIQGSAAGRFHPDLAAQFTTVPNQVQSGWRLVAGVWTAPEQVEPEPAPEAPRQLPIIDLLRLFTTAELAGFNALRKTCAALEPADYAAASGGDQEKAALVGFEVFLTYYDALRAGLIELNHPDTIAGLGLLVPLGVLTPQRLAQVLAGERPE